jgi:CubicO group peptidase (beta-lactamase class C family)
VRLAAQPLQFAPGVQQSYSSIGYDLLGVIIHRVTGSVWNNFVRDQIVQPLEMRSPDQPQRGAPAGPSHRR